MPFRSCAVALVFAVLVASCGSGDDGTSQGSGASTSAPPNTAVAATTPSEVAGSTAPPPTVTPTATDAPAGTTTTTTDATRSTVAPVTDSTTPVTTIEPDWANYSYPVACLGVRSNPVVLVDGVQVSTPETLYAQLVATSDAGGGATLVTLACDEDVFINGHHVILVGPDGAVLDDLALLNARRVDDGTFESAVVEGWEPLGPNTAASVSRDRVGVEGGKIVVESGEPIPKCAAMGTQDWAGEYTVMQGELVRRFQQRLIDVGYGAKIEASGGADGRYGFGTAEAFTEYYLGTHGGADGGIDMTEPAPWFGEGEGGPLIIYWVGREWADVLDIDCARGYHEG